MNVIVERYHCESFRYHLWPLLSLNSSIELPSTNQFQQFDIDRVLTTNPRRLLDTINKTSLKVLNLSFIPTLTSPELALVITDCKNLIKLDLSGLNLILQVSEYNAIKKYHI